MEPSAEPVAGDLRAERRPPGLWTSPRRERPVAARDQCPWRRLDPDQDGVLDAQDNCPDVYNPTQSNGDSDVAGDACDTDAALCSSDCRDRFYLSKNRAIPYYGNYPLHERNAEVNRAIIVVHGAGRTAEGYFDSVLGPALEEEVAAHTLVIAPHFQIEGDDDIATADIVWGGSAWKWGGLSATDNQVTSFDVMDAIVERISNRQSFPNIDSLVIAGHSAGGQFVQRYAAASPEVPDMCTPVRFVVANPSSYLYLNELRPELAKSPTPHDGFVISTQTCSGAYDRYGYGISDNLYYYLATHDPAGIVDRYTSRHVTYLLGADDTRRNADSDDTDVCDGYVNTTSNGLLDRSCSADLQGCNRYERGLWFYRYVQSFFPDSPHELRVASGVGHSGHDMFDHSVGRAALFVD